MDTAAFIISAMGAFLLSTNTRHSIFGWWVFILGNALWMAWAWYDHWTIIAQNGIFFIINVNAVWRRRKEYKSYFVR